MNEWILSITGLVILSTILFAVMPKGKTAVLIKSVVSIMSLTVLLKPVISLKNADFDNFFEVLSQDIILDDNYLDFSANEKQIQLEKDLKTFLINEGIACKKVLISMSYSEDGALSTNYVKIYLQNDEKSLNYTHKDIIEKAASYVNTYVITDVNLFEIYE